MLSFSPSLVWRKGTLRACCFTALFVWLWCRTLHSLFAAPQQRQVKTFMSALPAELPEAQLSLPTFSHRIIRVGQAHPADGELGPEAKTPTGTKAGRILGFPRLSSSRTPEQLLLSLRSFIPAPLSFYQGPELLWGQNPLVEFGKGPGDICVAAVAKGDAIPGR